MAMRATAGLTIAMIAGMAARPAAAPKTHRLEATPATVAYGYYWADAKPVLRCRRSFMCSLLVTLGVLWFDQGSYARIPLRGLPAVRSEPFGRSAVATLPDRTRRLPR